MTETETEIARLTRERDEARERAASLSRELLTAIQARDSYRASAELRALLREVAEGGVEFADERVRYVAVQIDADTWARVKAITVPAEEDGRDE